MKRTLLSLLAALTLLLGQASAVGAGESWCEDDPPVWITTPKGNQVLVHVTNYAKGSKHVEALASAKIWYTVESEGKRKSVATIYVHIPHSKHGKFETKSVVSSLPSAQGTIYESDTYESGQTIELEVELNVP